MVELKKTSTLYWILALIKEIGLPGISVTSSCPILLAGPWRKHGWGSWGGPSPPPFQTFGCGKSGKIEVRSTMESRSTEKHLGIGSQANAAGYIALTGLASCKRGKNAYYCTWTATSCAKNVQKIFTFFLITWIAALSAKNGLKTIQNVFGKKILA